MEDRGRSETDPLAAERAALAAEQAALEQARLDLLATLAHELRTPLTLIRTSIGLLLERDPEPAMRARLLRNIKHSTDQMHRLVSDLLELARLRGGQPDLQVRAVDLGRLAARVAALLRPLFDEHRQTLTLRAPAPAPVVLGDARRLEQVLVNLLDNAQTYAGAGARVTVTVRDMGATAEVAVADTGPGIPPPAQARLFEQFYTARTSSTSHTIGVGLGLPIAQGIVAAHGGRLWVESVVGQGSVFRFTLPKEGPEAADEDPGGG